MVKGETYISGYEFSYTLFSERTRHGRARLFVGSAKRTAAVHGY